MAPKEGTSTKHKLLTRGVLPRISGRRDARNGRQKMAASLLTLGVMLAWDSTGQTLPVQMAQTDNGWNLYVDDQQAVYPTSIDPVIVNENAKLLASDAEINDRFGVSVAVSADLVVVGAKGDRVGCFTCVSGSAYVFARSGNGWVEQSQLLASALEGGFTEFGRSVAVAGDTAVVGAWADQTGARSGSAFVYVRNGSTWTEEQKLLPSDAFPNDMFGWSVAVSADTLVVVHGRRSSQTD